MQKTFYTCDHCGAGLPPFIGEQWRASFLTVGAAINDVQGCSKEHLGLGLAKVFGLPQDVDIAGKLAAESAESARLRHAVRDNFDTIAQLQAQVVALEARSPANEVQHHERAQYEITIARQRERIAELQTAVNMHEAAAALEDGQP